MNTNFALVLTSLWLALWPTTFVRAAPLPDSDSNEALEIAVAPFLPAATIIQNYQPLRAFLAHHLKQPVIFVTAPDYKTFYARTQRREFPLVITVANAAYLAHAESGYVPMLQPLIKTSPVLVVARNSRLSRVDALRGKKLALPDPLAIISMQGVQMLRESGLDPDKDLKLIHLPNHSIAVNHVISGEADAAIVSDRALQQLSPVGQDAVRIIHQWKTAAAPGVVYLANPAMSPQRIAQLTEAIQYFIHKTGSGQKFIRKLGYGDLIPVTAAELAPLAPYGETFRTLVAKMNLKDQP